MITICKSMGTHRVKKENKSRVFFFSKSDIVEVEKSVCAFKASYWLANGCHLFQSISLERRLFLTETILRLIHTRKLSEKILHGLLLPWMISVNDTVRNPCKSHDKSALHVFILVCREQARTSNIVARRRACMLSIHKTAGSSGESILVVTDKDN